MLYFPHVVADDPIVNLEQKRGQTCSFSKKNKINLFMRKEQCVLKLFTHTHTPLSPKHSNKHLLFGRPRLHLSGGKPHSRPKPALISPPLPDKKCYLVAQAVRSASSGRRCPAGVCGFSASCTECTLWLCLGFELETPVW